jgi:hypothetical protein
MRNLHKEHNFGLPPHVEHWKAGPVIVRTQPDEGAHPASAQTYTVRVAIDGLGGYRLAREGLTYWQTTHLLHAVAGGALIAPGEWETDFFGMWINQAERECYAVKWTPTRVRIEYEMPNTGLNGGWRYWLDLGAGWRFILPGDKI